ncbi:hypothetical protein [Candidatus Methylacidiphilum infernorum]|uniref:Uncharacterized protein n=1 Tax=Methylacidiphilum infernorum (isolate V4) TaxID=481448 RepID=B3E1D8_METI4|nr:hypothetical protein [Candidatus Methylacidiphilum infernorum]ACD82934.1 Hypothetical protein Minf_0879 [Methylacidiphilum infernorum V4]
MNGQRLYLLRQDLAGRLTIGLLRQHISGNDPSWISLEPRAWLLECDGSFLWGRLRWLYPLVRRLPDGLDDLPLLAATLYEPNRWHHFYDAQPLSRLPAQKITWSLLPLDSPENVQQIDGLECKTTEVYCWQDIGRFGLSPDHLLREPLSIKHFFLKGRRVAWTLDL